jgi:hypothetical protein
MADSFSKQRAKLNKVRKVRVPKDKKSWAFRDAPDGAPPLRGRRIS